MYLLPELGTLHVASAPALLSLFLTDQSQQRFQSVGRSGVPVKKSISDHGNVVASIAADSDSKLTLYKLEVCD